MEPVRSHPVAQNEAAKLEPATGDGKVKLVREEVDRLHKMGPVDSHRVAPESMEGLIQREKSQVGGFFFRECRHGHLSSPPPERRGGGSKLFRRTPKSIERMYISQGPRESPPPRRTARCSCSCL